MNRIVNRDSIIPSKNIEKNNHSYQVSGAKERKLFQKFITQNWNKFYDIDLDLSNILFSPDFGYDRWDVVLLNTKFGNIITEIKVRYKNIDIYTSLWKCLQETSKIQDLLEIDIDFENNLKNNLFVKKYNQSKEDVKWCKDNSDWGALIEKDKFDFLIYQKYDKKLYINFFNDATIIFDLEKLNPKWITRLHNANTEDITNGKTYWNKVEKDCFYIPMEDGKLYPNFNNKF